MLSSANLSDKSYEELLTEAISQIPLYSKEWSNFNLSDPGITVLQNLTAFQLVQQATINEIPERLRRKLLRLVGMEGNRNHPATVLLQAPHAGFELLPKGHRLWAGAMPFETVEPMQLEPWSLVAAYACADETVRDITYLLDTRNDAYAHPFGKQARQGAALVCIFSGVPEMGRPLRLWVQPAQEALRNPFTGGSCPKFSTYRWQYYTQNGWQDAQMVDETHGFLQAGEILLTLDGANPAVCTDYPTHGCALRCVLDWADFDRTPRLQTLAAHLFPVVQQQTHGQCLYFPGDEPVELTDALSLRGNLFVYCKETADGPYYAYRPASAAAGMGRYYLRREEADRIVLTFSPETFGTEIWDGPDAVCVCGYDDEMVHHRSLGPVQGYENQELQLDLLTQLLPDHFSVLLELPDQDGATVVRRVAPDCDEPDALRYTLDAETGLLTITQVGFGRGGQLLLGDCVTTHGSRGNLRACSTLEHRGGYDGTEVDQRFFSPAPGRGGVSHEGTEELRVRFSARMRTVTAAVQASDYEALARQVPGLCIHKVKAIAFGRKNLIKLVVKPHTESPHPQLSAGYLQQISAFLEPRRMLTTRFELEQPRYVPIHVAATVCVRGVTAQEEALAEMEAMLRQLLDYENGPQSFGDWVRFNEIYQALNSLRFVEAVDVLNIYPEGPGASVVGRDIQLGPYSLCYPGDISLSLRANSR